MLCNLSVCKTCLTRLGNTNKFVRFKSHYVVLDISQKATQKEIRDAYIKLSKQFHPDQNRHSRRSHDKFVQISQAYEVLGKDSSRREYDQKIASQYPRPTSNPYQSSTRPANYYSSGQFYEDRAYRTGFDPSNPYARRSSDTFRNDPFSDLNYDYSFYQRKRDEQASERREEERNPNDNWETDPVIIAFDRIFWAMVIGMILYLLRDVLYSKYLDYNVTSLKEELERRKKLKEHEMARSVIRTISPDK